MESTRNAYFEQAEKAAHAEGIGLDAQAISLALLAVAEEVNILAARQEQISANESRERKVGRAAGF